jgi:hypothetical protein
MTSKLRELLSNNFRKKLELIKRMQEVKFARRIFCISIQKTGTTSVGNFFQEFGFPTAQWEDSDKGNWTKKWYDGDFESIFGSPFFKSFQVFEDTPWWFPEFYKVLYHRFPNAKFILFVRSADDWFESMCKAYHGESEETLKIHAKLYRREDEFYREIESLNDIEQKRKALIRFMDLNNKADHYKSLYRMRNREVIQYFEDRESNKLIVCDLNDKNKWNKLANFFNFTIPEDFSIHSNRT